MASPPTSANRPDLPAAQAHMRLLQMTEGRTFFVCPEVTTGDD